MFDRDEKNRVNINGIKKHRWYNKPVPEVFQKALQNLTEEQAKRDALVKALSFKVCYKCCEICTAIEESNNSHRLVAYGVLFV